MTDKEAATRAESPRAAVSRALKLLRFRLRVPLCLLLAAVVAGKWEAIANYADLLMRSRDPLAEPQTAVSSDTEYFCPMDPGVVSGWPGKCGVCNMSLVRRKKMDALVPPEGVTARMQFSPYRLTLAGIRTAAVAPKPLVVEAQAAGIVSRAGSETTPEVTAPAGIMPWLETGDKALVHTGSQPGAPARPAKVRRISALDTAPGMLRIELELADRSSGIADGAIVDVTFQKPVAEIEPFRSMPTGVPPVADSEPTAVYVCSRHPDQVALAPGECPRDNQPLAERALSDRERVRYACPHRHEPPTADASKTCSACGGAPMSPTVVSYLPQGSVLAIPETSVLDSAGRALVFVETMEGVFDAVEVVLGPRAGAEYPVIKGVSEGQRVVAAGAFLLDAETRINPAAAADYFGSRRSASAPAAKASVRGPIAHEDSASDLEQALAELTPDERAGVLAQKVCPITHRPLGSMGKPVAFALGGRTVFLCCEGCVSKYQTQSRSHLESGPDADHD